MSSCCGKDEVKEEKAASASCCAPEKPKVSSCCGEEVGSSRRVDWLFWTTMPAVALLYAVYLLAGEGSLPQGVATLSHTAFEMMNAMWWGLVLAALFVGLLERVPQEWVVAILGSGSSRRGVLRATLAGLMLDLCSHGILMVGMKLYQRGASLGQVIAFLVASPWNSLSLTLILITLIGLPWTLLFIALSMAVGVIAGLVVQHWVAEGRLPDNPNEVDLPHDFHLAAEVRSSLAATRLTPSLFLSVLWDGAKGSRMVLRWVFLGVLLAGLVRAFIEVDTFQTLFGPTLVGLLLTLLAATVIEVCSEGSTPIAADLFNRGGAPGNSFAFLMTGVSTDYTEIMSLRDTTGSWKLALVLPLVTVPQVIVVGFILNQFAG